jgi:hypothetical protein
MTQRGSTDPIVKSLQREGMPITIENWVDRAYPEGPPGELAARGGCAAGAAGRPGAVSLNQEPQPSASSSG